MIISMSNSKATLIPDLVLFLKNLFFFTNNLWNKLFNMTLQTTVPCCMLVWSMTRSSQQDWYENHLQGQKTWYFLLPYIVCWLLQPQSDRMGNHLFLIFCLELCDQWIFLLRSLLFCLILVLRKSFAQGYIKLTL